MKSVKPNNLSRSSALAAKVTCVAFKILCHDGPLTDQKLKSIIQETTSFDKWQSEKYSKSRRIRWQSVLSLHFIKCKKVGYVVKKNGLWSLTKKGTKVIDLGERRLFEVTNEAVQDHLITGTTQPSSVSRYTRALCWGLFDIFS